MSPWDAILEEAVRSYTLWPIVCVLLLGPLVRLRAPEERGRLWRAGVWLALHLILLPVVAQMRAQAAPGLAEITLALHFFAAMAVIEVLASFVVVVVLQRLWRAPLLLRDLLVVGVGSVAFFSLAARAGLNLSGLIATSAVLTAVVGLSLQDTLGNVMAGVALQLDQSVRVGDWIKVGDTSGRVSQIRWRSTSVETRNWETLVVPNSILVRGPFLALGRREHAPALWRRWVYFNVDFRYAPNDVIAAVDQMLVRDPIANAAGDPLPHCIVMELAESYARYAVRYWLTDPQKDDLTDSLVRTRIYYALRRADIPLSVPAHAVFVTKESPHTKEQRSSDERQKRLAALERIDLFDPLEAADKQRLAEGLRYAPFTAGEVITRQGDQAHWLYLICEGQAQVSVRGESGQERAVAQLRAGDVFGEMALLTGAPRSATVTATTDVECYRLDKAVFQEVIEHRPELAEHMATILAQRTVGLEAARQQLDADVRQQRLAAAQHDFVSRIKGFFGLH
jgi:small-conductance mechanosensitive channel/CRP-like cAMP-binding protein